MGDNTYTTFSIGVAYKMIKVYAVTFIVSILALTISILCNMIDIDRAMCIVLGIGIVGFTTSIFVVVPFVIKYEKELGITQGDK